MSVFGFLGEALTRGATAIEPLFGPAAMAVAIVACTLAVRAALHPLARAAARGEKARTALAPQLAALQRTHKGDPERLQKAMADLYATTGASPLAGCLPTLLQMPVFFVMYHLFSTGGGGLLEHTLLGAPLGGHWSQALADGGVFGPQGRVYLGLFLLIAAVATWNFRRARAAVATAPAPAAGGALPGMASLSKVLPLLSFGTLITVAVVPLAAGLYMVTTTTWTACERALLHRDRQQPAPEEQPAAEAVPADPAPAAPAARRQRPAPKSRAARQRAARTRAGANTRPATAGTPARAEAAAPAGPTATTAR
ncbi:YidC/Oxa1 family membrane protein insertase [Streptomyces lydicus]